jgi:hypothetical protein
LHATAHKGAGFVTHLWKCAAFLWGKIGEKWHGIFHLTDFRQQHCCCFCGYAGRYTIYWIHGLFFLVFGMRIISVVRTVNPLAKKPASVNQSSDPNTPRSTAKSSIILNTATPYHGDQVREKHHLWIGRIFNHKRFPLSGRR